MDRFDEKLKETRQHLTKKKIHHDNAHLSRVVASKLNELHYELLPHPPYSLQHETVAHGKKIMLKRVSHRRGGGVFWKVQQILIFGGVETMTGMLEKCVFLKGN